MEWVSDRCPLPCMKFRLQITIIVHQVRRYVSPHYVTIFPVLLQLFSKTISGVFVYALRRAVMLYFVQKNAYFAILFSYVITIFRYVIICTKKTRIEQYFSRSSRYVTFFLILLAFSSETTHCAVMLHFFDFVL